MNLAKNSLWLALARIGSLGMAVLFSIILARRLGSASFGEYAVIAAAIFIGNALTTFGTDMTVIREIASRDDLSLLPPALWIQLVLSVLFIGVTWLGAPLLLQNPSAILALRIYSFSLIPLAFFTVVTIALRGRQRMDAYAGLNLAGSILQLALAWFFVLPRTGIVTLATLLLLHQALVALGGILLCRFQVSGFWRDWRMKTDKIAALLKVNSPLAILTALGMTYQRMSVLLVSAMADPSMTGWFSAAQRTVEAAKTGHNAVFTALYPAMAQNRDESFRLSWSLLLVGAGIGAIALSALASPLTRILFGVEYEASAPALQILAWMLIPYTVNTFLTLKFVASHREKSVLWASSVSLVALVACSLWWIPRSGLTGASGSALVAEAIQSMALFFQWRRI